MSSQMPTAQWQTGRYGAFELTDAVRPASANAVIPREAFRFDVYRDRDSALRVPVLAAALSREKLFDVFLDLVGLLGSTADVVLESSHVSADGHHRDLFREQIDVPVLLSHFCDFEELLLNDGCAGVAALSTTQPLEVQFDEHKLLIVYAHDLEAAEAVFRQHDVPRDDRLKLISEGMHLHRTLPHHLDAFEQLCCRLGVGEPAERVNW